MNKQETAKCLAIITLEYPKFIATREKINLWHDLLGGYEALDVANAIKKHLLTSKWEPRIADINALLSAPEYPTALEAWGEVRNRIRRVGYYGAPKFTHPIISQTVDAIGWQVLCDMTQPDVMRSNFIKLYENQCAIGVVRCQLEGRKELEGGNVIELESVLKEMD